MNHYFLIKQDDNTFYSQEIIEGFEDGYFNRYFVRVSKEEGIVTLTNRNTGKIKLIVPIKSLVYYMQTGDENEKTNESE